MQKTYPWPFFHHPFRSLGPTSCKESSQNPASLQARGPASPTHRVRPSSEHPQHLRPQTRDSRRGSPTPSHWELPLPRRESQSGRPPLSWALCAHGPSLSAVCHTQFPRLSASLLAFLQAGPVPGRPPSLLGPIHESHLCWVPQTPLSPPQTNGVLSKTLGCCTQGQIYSLPGVAASGVGSQAICLSQHPCPALKWG